MNLELSSEEARALDLGHRWGVISRDRITNIADQIIVSSDGPASSEICQLAVCKRDFQIQEVLAAFIKKPSKWQPVSILLKRYLSLEELEYETRVSLYHSISNFADWDDPEPWRTVKGLEHELGDARQKIWGEAESILEEKSIENDIFNILTSL